MAEIGFSGLNDSAGIIQEDFLREWRMPESYKRANEMRLNSPVVGALLGAIELSIKKVEWTLTSELGEDDQRLEVWKSTIDHMEGGWKQFVSESLTALPFGFALFEIVWGRFENYVIAAKLAPRGQDTVWSWDLESNGSLKGFTQVAAPRYKSVYIPIEKLVHIRSRVEKNNPEGRSILRSAWIPYYYAKNISQIEAIGIERDLAGMPTITLPQGADTGNTTTSDAGKAAKMVRNIRRDEQEGIVLPFGWTLTLLSTGGSRQFDTDKVIGRYNSQILMSALAQFLMLGQGATGSYALSSDQSDLFNMAVNSIADMISDAVNVQLIPRLMRLNGFDSDGLKLDHSPAGDMDIQVLASFLASVGDKITWLPADETWLRQVANLPERSEEEIQEAKEEAQARAMELMQKSPASSDTEQRTPAREAPATDEEEAEEDQRGDDMSVKAVVDWYKSERPDDVKRRRYYRKYQRELQGVFAKLGRRIKKEMRQ
jgi:hypothetical protein